MQPKAPLVNVLLKTHKNGMSLRPLINNTHAPAQRLAKYINTKIQIRQVLPNTCNNKNSISTAQNLINLTTKLSLWILKVFTQIYTPRES